MYCQENAYWKGSTESSVEEKGVLEKGYSEKCALRVCTGGAM